MKILIGVASLVLILSLATATPSLASRPVPKTIMGCVVNGILHSSDGYEIKVMNVSLTPYEGKRIQAEGNLLPGDNFHVIPSSVRVLGNCSKRPR